MKPVNVWIIYVLLLEDDCWYIGQTTSNVFQRRMKHHWTHPTKGAIWTRKHKPVRVYSIDTYDRRIDGSEISKLEDIKTLKFAALYGFESVRGGAYCQRYPTWPMGAKNAKTKRRKRGALSAEIEKATRELALSSKALK